MKRRLFIIVLLFITTTGVFVSAKDIRIVKAIEFKGCALLNKYDIIRGARFKAIRDGIVIDVDSLEASLSKNSFIQSFSISETNGRMIIAVDEKKPELILAVEGKDGSTLYEIDAGNNILSKNDVHTNRVPVVFISGAALSREGVSGEIKQLLSLLGRIKKNAGAIYRELSEIYCIGASIRVVLRGRRTGFIMKPEGLEFIKLGHIVGYLDRMNRYPEEINMSGNAVVVR